MASVLACVAVALLPTMAWAQAEDVRTFPAFVGTWVLDEAARTGRMRMAPPPAQTLTLATTSTEVTVTRTLNFLPVAGTRGQTGGDEHAAAGGVQTQWVAHASA